MSFSLNAKGNKRLLIFVSIFVFSFFYFMPTFKPHRALSHKLQVPSSYQISEGAQVNFKNLNSDQVEQQQQQQQQQPHEVQQQQQRKPLAKILVLTPLKDAVPYLDRYFELLDETTYPNHLISLAFLVSDTTDNTIEELNRHANTLQNRFWWNRFNDIRVFQKDFKFDLPNEQRHKYEMQPLRRSVMARSRNYLLSSALRDEFEYVAWVDVDVVKYPATIFEDLMAADEDVVVPNCLLNREDGSFW
jgi:hypothetical protein